MIEQLTPSYRFVCDRCGTEQFGNENNELGAYPISFSNNFRVVRIGVVCHNCYTDFCEIAENFFDEVNKDERKR